MQLIIFEFEVAPFLEEYEKVFNEPLLDRYSHEYFAKLVILSIVHLHCILMLNKSAYQVYESASIDLRNRVDHIVERLIIDGDENYYQDFTNLLHGSLSVNRIRLRRKRTFEVYCD